MACDLACWQASGGEEWMEKDVYDIGAGPAVQSGTYSLRHTRFGIGDARVRQMPETLLADRFQLKLHRATKTGAISPLAKSGKAVQLKPAKYTDDQPLQGTADFSGGRICQRALVRLR
jgi:uncharacterized protein (TIGR03435 family)